MKNKLLFSLFVLLFFNSSAQNMLNLKSKNAVSEETARIVGAKFMGFNPGVSYRSGDTLVLDTVFKTSNGENAIYVFNTAGGFVMVAADTRVTPVVAYSKESQFSCENMPESLQKLLDSYVSQIKFVMDSVKTSEYSHSLSSWYQYVSESQQYTSRNHNVVQPLLTTTWNQNHPYNLLCPADPAGPEGHVYAGCVATALAQIFKYWSQPANGLGSNSYNCNFTSEGYGNYGFLSVDFTTGNYNYNMMPNSLSNATSEEIAEVAKLIYHCGVAVEMKYGANGSGAFDSKALSALKNFFGYTTAQLVKKTAYTDPEWKSLLKSELLQMRPVYYSGSGSSGGHAFVCDGFDENDMFHFNWGWSGSNNGYYTLTSLTPGNKNFSSGQTAIIGIDAAQPKIRASKHAVSFLSPCGTVSESKSVFIISTSLVQTINATVVGNFGVSIDSSTYLQNLDINSTGGKLYIRHNGSEVGATEQGLLILSSGSATDTVYLTGNTFVDVFDCLPPQNLVISTQDLQHINLNWNSPTVDHDPKYLSWSSENVSVFSGYASYYRFTMLQRYSETDILPYHNKSITAIRFYADAEANLFKAVVYSGGSFEGGFNPGTLVYSQDIDRSSLNLNGWNTITLDTSVIVDAAQELCFGIYLEAPAGTYAIPRCSGGVAYKGCVYGYHSSNSVSWNEYSQEYTYPLGVIVENAQKVVDYTILRDGSILGTTNDPFYQDYVDSSKTFNYTVVANWSNNCSDSTMKSFKNVAQISSVPERVDIFTNYGYGLNVKKVVIAGCGLESSIHAFVDGDFQISSDSVNYSSSQTLPASGGALFVRYSPSSSSEQFESGLLILSSDNIVTNVPITAQIYNECTPPKNLLLSQNGNNISLTWESPDLQTVQQCPLSWYESPGNLSYGSNHSEIKRYIVHRFDTNDLAPYHGKQLTSVSFIPHNSVTTYKIVVYKGGSERTSQYFSSGTKIVEQDVDISTLTAGEWNSIQLQNPVMVDASQELWYGVYLESPKGSYPIQLGTPYVAKKGLITKPSTNPDNYWTEYSVNSLSYCFSLKSTIEDVPNTLSKFLIDRNEIEVGETNENYYSDTLIYNGGYDYRVWALWNDGCKVAISDSIFVADLCDREGVSFSEESCNEYVWNDVTYLESGTYYHSYLLPNGCLSTDTLHLTINTAQHQSQTHTAIDSYAWNGTTYTESGTYTYSHTDENGCEQVDTLHLTVHHSTAIEVYATACDNYTWNAETYTSSGNYVQTFLTSHGADSIVTLHLTINNSVTETAEQTICSSELPYSWRDTIFGAGSKSGDYMFTKTAANGCDSVVTLHLTINNSVTETTEQTICSSELPYNWRDTIFGAGTESGDYVFTKTTANGCDSVVTLHLTINNSVTETTEQTICSSELPYTWRDTIFGAGSESGDYVFNRTSANGCDSVVTLHLIINNSVIETAEQTICSNELPYTWRDTVFGAGSESGDYVFTKTAANGCDSVVTLHLTINNSITETAEQTICSSELPYTWRDTVFGVDTESGEYMFTKTAANGCDSIVTLHLTINTPQHQSQTHTAIDSYAWNGTTYTESGTYTYSHTDENGCEQVDTLHLTVHHSTANEIYATACDNYTWNAETYIVSGDYVQTFSTVNGADSIVTLHLTINNGTFNSETVAECGSYEWHGETYTESGTYVHEYTNDDGCQSADTLHLTINNSVTEITEQTICSNELPYTWRDTIFGVDTESGEYVFTRTAANGCDSVVTLQLTINNSVTETAEQTICSSELPYTWRDTIFGAGSEIGDYVFTKTAASGCDSVVTLHLTINSGTFNAETVAECGFYEWQGETYTESGTYVHEYTNDKGCQSTDTLHLIINNSVTETAEQTICSNELPYTWRDTIFGAGSESGDYVFTKTAANGCDSVVTLHLTINAPQHQSQTHTAIDSYAWNGTTYTESGTYMYSHTDENGCEQVDTLHLTLHYSTANEVYATACDNYTWNAETYTVSGNYVQTFQTAHGADSVVTLHLTINNSVTETAEQTICSSELPYTWRDTIFEAGSGSGDYVFTKTAANGCDSIVALHLTINTPQHQSQTHTAIDSYAWNGTTYTESGTYTYSHTDENGCDQVDTLHLTLHYSTANEVYATACDNYTWNAETYTSSGDYEQTFQTAHGADSVVTLHLTINNSVTETAEQAICSDELPYTWRDTIFGAGSESGDYVFTKTTSNGCDSVVTLHLTINTPQHQSQTHTAIDSYAWNGTTYTESGTYTYSHTDENGCDQVDTLHLTLHYSTANEIYATACDNYTWNTETYTVSGNYVQTFQTAHGADSVVTLHLTINNSVTETAEQTICSNELPYTWRDTIFGAGSESGDYVFTKTTSNGCDSIVTLHLTINAPQHQSQTHTAIDSYAWNGTTYTVSGTYMYSHTDENGCEQVDTLHLTVHHSTAIEVYATACDNYTWNAETYTSSGDYEQTFLTDHGADSIVTLHLTINNGTFNAETVAECGSYEWQGETYTESGIYVYEYTNDEGCQSTDTLHLTINNSVTETAEQTICSNELPYIWRDTIFGAGSESGDYVFTKTAANGCDSLVTLHLTINNSVTEIAEQTICSSELPYTWRDTIFEAWSGSGDYVFNRTSANGCDSVVTLHLIINNSVTETTEQTICSSELPYTWRDTIFGAGSESGDYVFTKTAANGCDSIVTLHLTINAPQHQSQTHTAIDSYAWNGTTYTESGTYTYSHTDENGCEQVDTLHLTLHYSTANEVYATACDNYTWNAETYTSSGDYEQTFQTAHGADSVVTLHLTINNSVTEITYLAICSSELPYIWRDTVFGVGTESGDYVFTRTAANGCDSVVTLHLTINSGTFNAETVAECGSYEWHGATYTESGTYVHEYTNDDGCQSADTLHLTINNSVTETAEQTICSNELPYTWRDTIFGADSESGDYVFTRTAANGCDSVVTLHLTINNSVFTDTIVLSQDSCFIWNGLSYCESGDYVQEFTALNGCDSLVTLHLTIVVGINDLNNNKPHVVVYPNPATDILKVDFGCGGCAVENAVMQIVDMYGKVVWGEGIKKGEAAISSPYNTNFIDVSHLANGVYLLRITTGDGSVAKAFVKQ